MKEYIGGFELRPGFDLVMTVVDGNLVVTPTGQSPDTLLAESKDHFFSKRVDATIEFVRGSGGKVTHLMLNQGGFLRKAPKKP